MKIITLITAVLLISIEISAQKNGGTQCPWGCPTFSMAGSSLNAKAKDILSQISVKMKQYPDCQITINGYSDTSTSGTRLSWLRLNSIKNHLTTVNNISADRITPNIITGKSSNVINIKTEYNFESDNKDSLPDPCPCDYPSILFKEADYNLNPASKNLLSSVATKLKDNPVCNIVISGTPEASKEKQSQCFKRLEKIKTFLVESMGISSDRISVDCEINGGDKNRVEIKCN